MSSSSLKIRSIALAAAVAVKKLGDAFAETAKVVRKDFVDRYIHESIQSGRPTVTLASRGNRRCNAAALKRVRRKARNVRVCNGGRS